jgi:hypothetical protein
LRGGGGASTANSASQSTSSRGGAGGDGRACSALGLAGGVDADERRASESRSPPLRALKRRGRRHVSA